MPDTARTIIERAKHKKLIVDTIGLMQIGHKAHARPVRSIKLAGEC